MRSTYLVYLNLPSDLNLMNDFAPRNSKALAPDTALRSFADRNHHHDSRRAREADQLSNTNRVEAFHWAGVETLRRDRKHKVLAGERGLFNCCFAARRIGAHHRFKESDQVKQNPFQWRQPLISVNDRNQFPVIIVKVFSRIIFDRIK
jgi:hypothetical protein